MKKLFKYLLLFPLLFSNACSDMLDEQVETFLISENIYNTEAGSNTAINGLYAQFIDHFYFRSAYYALFYNVSGLFHNKHGNTSSKENGTLSTISSNKFVNDVYGSIYRSISTANDIIYNLDGSDAFDTEARDAILGDAYFIRGFDYFNLVRAWGGVPLRLEPVTIESIHVSRTPEEEIYQTVIDDLTMAKNLMVEPGQQISGRPHKYAAQAMLAKVYLTMASKSEDPNSPYWQMARDESLEVVNNGGYELMPNFESLWDVQGNNNKESVFEIQTNTDNLANLQHVRFFLPKFHVSYNGTSGWNRFRVNKEVFDGHVAAYPGDPRIDVTFIYDSFVDSRGKTVKVYPKDKKKEGWPYLAKHIGSDFTPTRNSNRNLVVMRYADVLLILAEAENMVNGPDAAYQYVNLLLARARTMPDGSEAAEPADWTGLSTDDFNQKIILERRYELFGEPDDFFENRRHGEQHLMDIILNHNNYSEFVDGKDVKYLESTRTYLLPIPSSEINANQKITPADQNPGY